MTDLNQRFLSRRDVLRATAAGAALSGIGAMCPSFVRSAGAGALAGHKRLVVLFLEGGNDGLNTVVPVTNNAYYDKRSELFLEASQCLALNGTSDYKLNPKLSRLGALFNDEGSVAIINKVGYPLTNGSHFHSRDIWGRGVRGEFADLGMRRSGWVARYLDAHAPSSSRAVSFGHSRPEAFFGGETQPLSFENLYQYIIRRDLADHDRHKQTQELVDRILAQHTSTGSSDLARESTEVGRQFVDFVQTAREEFAGTPYGEAYEGSEPGRHLGPISALIHAGLDASIYYCKQTGYDTHANQGLLDGRHGELLGNLDSTLGTFVDDLKQQGVWNDTVILLVGEFGRRNNDNGSKGTDHGSANAVLALGGAVNGGIYGPEITEQDISDHASLRYEIDFRDVYKRVLSSHLGVDPAPVFPEAQPKNNDIPFV